MEQPYVRVIISLLGGKMESKTKNYTMVVLSIALLASLGFNVMPEATHYCEERELKAYCFSLSDTLKTCYTLPAKQGGKRCLKGWQKVEGELEIESKLKYQQQKEVKYLCDNNNCIPF